MEQEHICVKLLKYLPKGETPDGERFIERDMIVFVARNGGIRNVEVEDLAVL